MQTEICARATTWQCRDRLLDLTRPLIMGIVNVTPDSFSDGGTHNEFEAAVAWGKRLAEQGADILDVGGESTRPGASEVSVEEEIRRVVPVVRALAQEGLAVSVDTSKPEVMQASLEAGACILNDIRAFELPGASGPNPLSRFLGERAINGVFKFPRGTIPAARQAMLFLLMRRSLHKCPPACFPSRRLPQH